MSSNDLIEAGPQVTVTPFYLETEPIQRDPGPWTTEPQLQSESHTLERMAALDANSSSSALLQPLPSSLPMIPAPVGLSSKELAQLRTEASGHSRTNNAGSTSGSHPDPSSTVPMIPAPVGLSSKELAQLRTEASERSRTNNVGSTSGSHPDPSPTATTGQSAAMPPPDPRRLQSEVENLRQEMQLLRAERFEAPPSYTEEERT
jgi:hypothetical protein